MRGISILSSNLAREQISLIIQMFNLVFYILRTNIPRDRSISVTRLHWQVGQTGREARLIAGQQGVGSLPLRAPCQTLAQRNTSSSGWRDSVSSGDEGPHRGRRKREGIRRLEWAWMLFEWVYADRKAVQHVWRCLPLDLCAQTGAWVCAHSLIVA